MEIAIYQLSYTGDPSEMRLYSFEPFPDGLSREVVVGGSAATFPADTGVVWQVRVPEGSSLEPEPRPEFPALTWPLGGERYRSTAAAALALAMVRMHGFGRVKCIGKFPADLIKIENLNKPKIKSESHARPARSIGKYRVVSRVYVRESDQPVTLEYVKEMLDYLLSCNPPPELADDPEPEAAPPT